MKPEEVKETGWYWAVFKQTTGFVPRWECVQVGGVGEWMDVNCVNNENSFRLDEFREFVGPILPPAPIEDRT